MFNINLTNLEAADVSALQASLAEKMGNASETEQPRLERIWNQVMEQITVPTT